MYKFLHNGYPKYFVPFLKLDIVLTRKIKADGVFLVVPLHYMSAKHFGPSFAYNAPKIWNDLPDVCLATSLHSFRKKLKTYLCTTISTLISLHGMDSVVSEVNDHSFLLFLFGAPGVCL